MFECNRSLFVLCFVGPVERMKFEMPWHPPFIASVILVVSELTCHLSTLQYAVIYTNINTATLYFVQMRGLDVVSHHFIGKMCVCVCPRVCRYVATSHTCSILMAIECAFK